jgi:hypothetical protein
MSKLLGGVISELLLILLNLDFEIEDPSWMNLGSFLNDIHIPTRAKYFPHSNSCLCWALLRDVSIWVLIFFSKMIFYAHYLLASPKNIGVHNSTLEYASTANIYSTFTLHNHGLAMLAYQTPLQNMRTPPVYWSHLKISFWRSDFLLNYQQNPQVLRRRSKKRRGERR